MREHPSPEMPRRRARYITAAELLTIRQMVAAGHPVAAGLVEYLLRDRDAWVDRAFGRTTSRIPEAE